MPWECCPTYSPGGLGSGDATKCGLWLRLLPVTGVWQPIVELELVTWPWETTWPLWDGWRVGCIGGTAVLLLYLTDWLVFVMAAELRGFWNNEQTNNIMMTITTINFSLVSTDYVLASFQANITFIVSYRVWRLSPTKTDENKNCIVMGISFPVRHQKYSKTFKYAKNP